MSKKRINLYREQINQLLDTIPIQLELLEETTL